LYVYSQEFEGIFEIFVVAEPGDDFAETVELIIARE